jgi:hypothetical protein
MTKQIIILSLVIYAIVIIAYSLQFIKDEDEYASGGYMAKGGGVTEKLNERHLSNPKNKIKKHFTKENYYVEIGDSVIYYGDTQQLGSVIYYGKVLDFLEGKGQYFNSGIAKIKIEKAIDYNGNVLEQGQVKKQLSVKVRDLLLDKDKLAMGGMMAKGGVIGNYELMPYIKGVNDTYNPKYQAKEYFEGTKDDAIEKANSMLSAEIGMVQVSIVNPKATNVLNRTKKIATVVYKDGGYMEKGGSVDNWVLYDNDTDEIISFHKSAKSAKSAANKILDAPIPKHKEVGFMLESNWNKEKEAIKKAQELRKHNKMAMGGVTFDDKVKAVKSSLLERKKVSPKVQKDYGKTYSPKEAEESAKRIVGSMTARERLKMKMAKKKKK